MKWYFLVPLGILIFVSLRLLAPWMTEMFVDLTYAYDQWVQETLDKWKRGRS